MLVHQLRQVVRQERPLAGEHLVADQAERVLIGPPVQVLPSLALFRRHILRGAQQIARRGERLLGGERLGDAEVGEDDSIAFLVDEDVVRLDIAMDDAATVRVGESIRRLRQVPEDLFERWLRVVPQEDAHTLAANERDSEERQASLVVDLVDLDDVGVIELALGAGLSCEALNDLGIIAEQREQHLDSDLAVERLLVAEEDDGHSAAP